MKENDAKYLETEKEITREAPYLTGAEANNYFIRGRGKYGKRVVCNTGDFLRAFGVNSLEPGKSASMYATRILGDLKRPHIPQPKKPEKLDYVV
jgi:hypothetical protein